MTTDQELNEAYRPATATESMASIERYRTFEKRLRDDLVRRIGKIFEEACQEALGRIREQYDDQQLP